jgi:hypothetical protein
MSDTHHARMRGIVHRLQHDIEPSGGDVSFSPDYTVTSTDDKGGKVLTDVEVILCFWGKSWTATPAPVPSADQYKQAIIGILSGPYMGRLGQYRGVGQGTLIYTDINDGSDPKNPYTDADVVAMLKDRLQNTTMPAPAAGKNRFYAVIVPQGVKNSLSQFAGQHQSFTVNGQTGYYAWVDNTGSLTGSNSTTKVFSHELIEACTNPDVDTSNNSILVQGKQSNGTAVVNDEIGDTCNGKFATVDMNGVQCSVQAYWSKVDNACILPLGTLSFWTDKSTFGKDEVQDVIAATGGLFPKAFWLVVEGFSRTAFTSLNVTVPLPTGSFANIPGVSIAQNPQIDFENGVDPGAPQRIRVGFDVTFSSASLGSFPTSGSQTFGLNGFIATDGNRVQGSDAAALFELVAGADPYFTNIDPAQGNVFYLSQDLRVFTATPGQNPNPVPGAPAFSNDSTAGAFSYVQQLLTWLNGNFSNPAATDPFATVLPGQTGALQGDSSVTPLTVDLSNIFNPKIFANYNFAIARVRLRGSAGPTGAARNTRVFFRLWTTQTCDTDFQPGSTYPSNADAAGQPGSPQVGAGHVTIPFFASGNLGASSDYNPGGANVRDVEIPGGSDQVWAYFGCFLNLYDQGNVVDGKPVQAWLSGTHHCLVAQIAFDDAPVIVGSSPESSDKLAQRNLQVTLSDNPGPAETHRIPQTFDIRPSPGVSGTPGAVDELMIDWGSVPGGTVASIYWPQVPATEVLELAAARGGGRGLSVADANTIRVTVADGVTYVPVPKGSGENLAGLLTLNLPTTVVTGQSFDVVLRRISRRQQIILRGREETSATGLPSSSRYVVGSFLVRIPVSTPTVMLPAEENTLAIMKWRLLQLAPSDRWRPVMQRYVAMLTDRVAGLGGDPSEVPPSPEGAPVKGRDRCDDVVEIRGKVAEVVFDCFGDPEGFVLLDCCERHAFRTQERGLANLILRACRARMMLSIFVLRHDRSQIRRVVVRG